MVERVELRERAVAALAGFLVGAAAPMLWQIETGQRRDYLPAAVLLFVAGPLIEGLIVGGVMRRTALALLVGFLVGVGVTLATIAATGGTMEYRLVGNDTPAADVLRMANAEGWQPVPSTSGLWLQRPRLRLGW